MSNMLEFHKDICLFFFNFIFKIDFYLIFSDELVLSIIFMLTLSIHIINSFASIYTSDNMFNIQNVWRIHVQVVTSKNCVVNKHMRVLQNAKDFNNFAYIKFCLKNNRFYRISAYHFFFAALATPIIFCLNANLLYFCR